MVIRSFRAALPAVVFASMLASGTVSRAAGATIHPAPTCVSPCNTIGIGTILVLYVEILSAATGLVP